MQDGKLQRSESKDNIPSRDQTFFPVSRLRFWELDPFFKCPLVGMCLTLSEQQQLLKKVGLAHHLRSPFEIHEMLVACGENENQLSRRIDNLFHCKFGREAGRLLGLDNERFMAEFNSVFQSGDYAAILWTAAVKTDLPRESKGEIFGKIHMTMHRNGEQSMRVKQLLARQEEELTGLRQGIEEGRRLRRALQKENESLQRGQADLRARLAAVERERVEAGDTGDKPGPDRRFDGEPEQQMRTMREEVDRLHAALEETRRVATSLQEENLRLSSELEKQEELNGRFLSESRDIIRELIALKRCNAQCPSFDLCKRRILIVGGMTKMASLYRDMIEGSGGVFEYHDGYMQKGDSRLESLLKRADVVLCPVNCNSHAACSLVKNLAKKHNKTVHMLANSSLSAISRVIWGADSGRGAINWEPVGRASRG